MKRTYTSVEYKLEIFALIPKDIDFNNKYVVVNAIEAAEKLFLKNNGFEKVIVESKIMLGRIFKCQ